MKELLLYAKNLESDFLNQDDNYQSKIDLGVSLLVTGDYQKAKSLFDAAIELDSKFPSGWIGKCFAEIASVSDENFNSLDIDEFIERSLKSGGNKLVKYEVVLSGCLAYRHAIIIQRSIESVESALALKQSADKEAALSASAALVGSALTGKSKSRTSNIIGGTLIAGGVGNTVRASMKSSEMQSLANSMFASALFQVYQSVPLISHCDILSNELDDEALKRTFLNVIDSWKKSCLYLYQKQLNQLIVKLSKSDFKDAAFVEKLLNNPNEIQEIGELKTYMRLIGLSNTETYRIFDQLFTADLPKIFSSPGALSNLSKSKVTQSRAYGVMGLGLIVGILWAVILPNDDHFLFYILTDISGIVVGIVMLKASQSKELKLLQAGIRSTIERVSSLRITPIDIDFKTL